MQENPEYKAFYNNVIGNEDMLREMATDPESAQAVFDKIQELTNGHMPGGETIALAAAVSESIGVQSKAASHFSDLDMLKIYGSYFEKWFQLEGFSNLGAGFSNPIFGAIQQAFTSSARNNHTLCFEYLITNVDIGDYDVDGLDLLIALKEQKVNILELIYLHADKETYGAKGALQHIMSPAIQEEYSRSARWLSPEIYSKLQEFNIIGTEEVCNVSS